MVWTNGPHATSFERPEFSPLQITTVSNKLTTSTNLTTTWFTNLDENLLGGCNYLGIFQMTNNSAFANWFTNVEVGITKKVVPIRFP